MWSSIALSQSSRGNALNLVEKATGQAVRLSETLFGVCLDPDGAVGRRHVGDF